MEILRRRLLFMWANYWLHHTLRLATEAGLALLIFSGSVTAVVVTSPHHKPPLAKPVATAPMPSTQKKAAAPKKTPPPSTPPSATPAATPATAPAPAKSAPRPVAPTQPAPGSGVKSLAPSTGGGTSSGAGTASPTNPASPADAIGGYYSTNWSGYAAMSGTFTAVSGSWIVQSVTGNGSTTTADAAWIGIGGVSSDDLIQTGTVNTVEADGTKSTFAFYELLPDAALEIPSLPVHTGDAMTASISLLSGSQWKISIADITTGQNYTTTVSYASSFSSAEWIEEDPSYLNGSLVPFNNFGHIEFSASSTVMNGGTKTLATSNAAPITLVNNVGQPIAVPSVLISGGSGFWVTHK